MTPNVSVGDDLTLDHHLPIPHSRRIHSHLCLYSALAQLNLVSPVPLPSMSLDKKRDPLSEKALSDASDDFDFGGESTLPSPPTLTPEEERRLWRKVDMRLMPILAVMYLFSFIDRGAFHCLPYTSTTNLTCFQETLVLTSRAFRDSIHRITCVNRECKATRSSVAAPLGRERIQYRIGEPSFTE